jgi:hypothetical protein
MRRELCVLAGVFALVAVSAAMGQSDPQRPTESPSQQVTVPPAQQPQQQWQRMQRPPEQPSSAQVEGAQGKQTQRPPICGRKILRVTSFRAHRRPGDQVHRDGRDLQHQSR